MLKRVIFIIFLVVILTPFFLKLSYANEVKSSLSNINHLSFLNKTLFEESSIEGHIIIFEDKLQENELQGFSKMNEVDHVDSNGKMILIDKENNLSLIELNSFYTKLDLEKSFKIYPNYKRSLMDLTPNDNDYSSQWALHNTGQTGGTSGKDMDAPLAWTYESSSQDDVVVGVIDTGAYLTHPDLSANLVGGWDFIDNDDTPYDFLYQYLSNGGISQSHGTHVAGIIAAVSDNSIGIAGVSIKNNIKVMPLRVDLTDYQISLAFQYAEDHGVGIINASFGGPYQGSLCNSISQFDGVVVASAGNSSENIDIYPMYPASCDLENVIAVSATDHNGNLASYSSYGGQTVDIAAPGSSILSTTVTHTPLLEERFNSLSVGTDISSSSFDELSGDWGIFQIGSNDFILGYDYSTLNSYSADQNGEVIFDTPQDTSGTTVPAVLNFKLYADIEWSSNCLSDYLSVSIDNNDDNWNEIARYCGYYYGSVQSIKLDFTNNLRVKYTWVTDSSIYDGSPPLIDDVILLSDNSVTLDYGLMSGTSMASPYVAGIVAMVKSADPTLPNEAIVELINKDAETYSSLINKVIKSAEVNLASYLKQRWEGFFKIEAYDSGERNWNIDSTKFMDSGDFNGDGKEDIIAMYDYADRSMGLWVFDDLENGSSPVSMYRSHPRGWTVAQTKFMDVGDVNNDGLDDVITLYDYGNNRIALFVFISDGTNLISEKWYDSGYGGWDISSTKFLSVGDFSGNAQDDIVMTYAYLDNTFALWRFTSSGTEFTTDKWYSSAAGEWNDSSIKFMVSGDVDNDGDDEIHLLQDAGSRSMRIYRYTNDTNSVMSEVYYSGYKNWDVSRTKFFDVGDFTNPSYGLYSHAANIDDIMTFYDYGNGNISLIGLDADDNYTGSTLYNSGVGNLYGSSIIHYTAGDFNNDSVDEIMMSYDMGNNRMKLWLFR